MLCQVHSLGFNPHTHEGCDDCYPDIASQLASFNPHTHEGCDADNDTDFLRYKVSIHTPTKGVTSPILAVNKLRAVSIHTPTKGVTHSIVLPIGRLCFNPHTHEGCDG